MGCNEAAQRDPFFDQSPAKRPPPRRHLFGPTRDKRLTSNDPFESEPPRCPVGGHRLTVVARSQVLHDVGQLGARIARPAVAHLPRRRRPRRVRQRRRGQGTALWRAPLVQDAVVVTRAVCTGAPDTQGPDTTSREKPTTLWLCFPESCIIVNPSVW